LGKGYTGETVDPAMGNFLVTFDTPSSFANFAVHVHGSFQFRIDQQVFMTPDAVGLDLPAPRFQDPDHLPFHPQREKRGMPQSVVGFEIILVDNIVMRHMAVVAMGFLPVRTVIPGGILGRHDVTVHAGFRFVGEVQMGFPEVH